MSNIEIRSAIIASGKKQWQIAEKLGFSETHFSRMLRRELPEKEKEKILAIIEDLTKEVQTHG